MFDVARWLNKAVRLYSNVVDIESNKSYNDTLRN